MNSKKGAPSTMPFAKLLWANVLRQQYLRGVTDTQLSSLLGVTTRTLANYRRDPSSVTIKQLQLIIDNLGLDPESLFRS